LLARPTLWILYLALQGPVEISNVAGVEAMPIECPAVLRCPSEYEAV